MKDRKLWSYEELLGAWVRERQRTREWLVSCVRPCKSEWLRNIFCDQEGTRRRGYIFSLFYWFEFFFCNIVSWVFSFPLILSLPFPFTYSYLFLLSFFFLVLIFLFTLSLFVLFCPICCSCFLFFILQLFFLSLLFLVLFGLVLNVVLVLFL